MIAGALLILARELAVTALFAGAAWQIYERFGPSATVLAVALAIIAGICGLKFAFQLLLFLPKLIIHLWIMRPSKRAGSAGWASFKERRKAGLHNKKNGLLVGLDDDRKPIFVNVESSGLVLSPAGGGKTISFVIPALCHSAESMFVPDLKGTLACMTAAMRRKKFKHKVLTLNPSRQHEKILGIGARYNPLQLLIDDWTDPKWQCQLMADAQAIALQLCQDPPNQGENQYFRNGSRKFLVFAFLYLIIIENRALLSEALRLISDSERFVSCLWVAASSNALKGDLASLAKDLLTKFEAKDTKQIESFREGAVQALDVFSASGSLAECTSASDFRFSDLKNEKMTIYVLADPTRINVFMPWLGLLSWCAITELIRSPSRAPVTFLLDEVTNFKIRGLPALLTLAREFKIRMWLVIQELAEWGNTYGRESLETLLSQTEVKLFMGNTSHRTCQLISDMLGEETVKGISHNLGKTLFDPVGKSVQDSARKLMTADEVRRSNKAILFVKNLRPMEIEKIGYHEIRPYSQQVGINPLFGNKLHGRNKLKL